MQCLQHVWAPDDILICGVLQQVLIQLEGGHLICIQQVDVSVCLPVYTSESLGSSANKYSTGQTAQQVVTYTFDINHSLMFALTTSVGSVFCIFLTSQLCFTGIRSTFRAGATHRPAQSRTGRTTQGPGSANLQANTATPNPNNAGSHWQVSFGMLRAQHHE